jgi:hypothetical protein
MRPLRPARATLEQPRPLHPGRSTGERQDALSHLLASHVGAAHVRIDTIEQALRDLCAMNVEGEGYRLAYRVAGDILRGGVRVVADSCNPIELTRREWEGVARDAGASFVNIEICLFRPARASPPGRAENGHGSRTAPAELAGRRGA